MASVIDRQEAAQDLQAANITPHTGSIISGIDLANLSDGEADKIRAALDERLVLVFRDQKLDRDQHKALARRFGIGELHRHPLNVSADPEISVVSADADSKQVPGDAWHSDTTAYPAPVAASLLYLTEMPESGGGDTVFINMYKALDSLSPAMRNFVSNLRSIHDASLPWSGMFGRSPQPGQSFPRTSHRVVLPHPRTGRDMLFVNRGFSSQIEELSRPESRAILDFLFQHAETDATLQCRVQWERGTLVLWDNIATQHHAIWDYYPQRRYAERVSVLGPVLDGAIAR